MIRVIVIGGGPAGITAAREAAALGAGVTVVEADQLGGRANWHSLLPSKVLLTAADRMLLSRQYTRLGLKGTTPHAGLEDLQARILSLAETWSGQQKAMLDRLRVPVRRGLACFEDAHHVRIEVPGQAVERVEFDAAIIATGSESALSPIQTPDSRRVLFPRSVRTLAEWPEKMVIIGGGVAGAEYTSFFNTLGVPVTWITDLNTFLPRCDDDISDELAGRLAERGVELMPKSPVDGVEADEDEVRVVLRSGCQVRGSHAFIAIGRQPDTHRLNLDAAQVAYTTQGVTVDRYCRTSHPHIYAVGDVSGPPFTVNRGQSQAMIAALNLMGRQGPSMREDILVEAIYSEPQIAQVGLTETSAWATGQAVRSLRCGYSQILKPLVSNEGDGFFKLLLEPISGRVLGGSAIGAHATELINLVSLAVMQGLSLDLLAGWFPAFPTFGELLSEAIVSQG